MSRELRSRRSNRIASAMSFGIASLLGAGGIALLVSADNSALVGFAVYFLAGGVFGAFAAGYLIGWTILEPSCKASYWGSFWTGVLVALVAFAIGAILPSWIMMVPQLFEGLISLDSRRIADFFGAMIGFPVLIFFAGGAFAAPVILPIGGLTGVALCYLGRRRRSK